MTHTKKNRPLDLLSQILLWMGCVLLCVRIVVDFLVFHSPDAFTPLIGALLCLAVVFIFVDSLLIKIKGLEPWLETTFLWDEALLRPTQFLFGLACTSGVAVSALTKDPSLTLTLWLIAFAGVFAVLSLLGIMFRKPLSNALVLSPSKTPHSDVCMFPDLWSWSDQKHGGWLGTTSLWGQRVMRNQPSPDTGNQDTLTHLVLHMLTKTNDVRLHISVPKHTFETFGVKLFFEYREVWSQKGKGVDVALKRLRHTLDSHHVAINPQHSHKMNEWHVFLNPTLGKMNISAHERMRIQKSITQHLDTEKLAKTRPQDL